jgi:hypothetical protein
MISGSKCLIPEFGGAHLSPEWNALSAKFFMGALVQQSGCRLHGGAPKGKANGRYSHGLLTAQAIEERGALSEILGGTIK